eukprot:TRINITY_DN4147_c0_g2_i1.p1 TRINITY_DN4147_c0_g2~~TRINITY_DN4147_c0_g2_i1.p1  ORF type:complete len:745 (-),score=122.13 TRINITY_DN4147_c0_g2_i1:61-2295(-)
MAAAPSSASADLKAVQALLAERAGGSFLRGWRRELDPTGQLEVTYPEFDRAVARSKLPVNADKFFEEIAYKPLAITDLAPVEGALVERFRDWCRETFGSSARILSGLNDAGGGSGAGASNGGTHALPRLTSTVFCTGCQKLGFDATADELMELWRCCDVDDTGSISQEEVAFLEIDSPTRELQAWKRKASTRDKRQKELAQVWIADGERHVHARHRLARRPWLADTFESLPAIVNQRSEKVKKQTRQSNLEARITFVKHIRGRFGNEVRAWRRALDPDGRFQVGIASVCCFCRHMDLAVDSRALWSSLDRDGDGWLMLEDLSADMADVLARFHNWAHGTFGSCAALWDEPKVEAARRAPRPNSRWASDKKMLLRAFEEALGLIGWKGESSRNSNAGTATSMLLSALDLYGCGFVSVEDLRWLDGWKPPAWLVATRDPEALAEFRSCVHRVFGHPIHAWRRILDKENSNHVSWKDFDNACQHLGFRGNMGGAWRSLDSELAGFISMKEYDESSCNLLSSFKSWAIVNFGSVENAFRAIDSDGGGTLSFSELKKACKNLRWDGDMRLLFDCLNVDARKGQKTVETGKRSLSLKEVLFLDSWEADVSPQQLEDEGLFRAALAKTPSGRLKKNRSAPSLSLSAPAMLLDASPERSSPMHKPSACATFVTVPKSTKPWSSHMKQPSPVSSPNGSRPPSAQRVVTSPLGISERWRAANPRSPLRPHALQPSLDQVASVRESPWRKCTITQ